MIAPRLGTLVVVVVVVAPTSSSSRLPGKTQRRRREGVGCTARHGTHRNGDGLPMLQLHPTIVLSKQRRRRVVVVGDGKSRLDQKMVMMKLMREGVVRSPHTHI